MFRPKGDRGQVLSSLVAVAAVVAIVAGLLVLFGTRGHDSKADETSGANTPKQSTKPSTIAASPPKLSSKPTAPATTPATTPSQAPSSKPTTAPTSQPTAPPATQPTAPTTRPAIPPDERPAAEIYNNTPRKGLADTVAGRARQAGWTVAGADNWHGKVAESTVYYPPGMLDAADQLARDIGVGRTTGALDNMKKDRLTVILTSDYTG